MVSLPSSLFLGLATTRPVSAPSGRARPCPPAHRVSVPVALHAAAREVRLLQHIYSTTTHSLCRVLCSTLLSRIYEKYREKTCGWDGLGRFIIPDGMGAVAWITNPSTGWLVPGG